jgi:hypothetical protein
VLVYADDIIATCDDEEEQQLLGQHLAKEVEIKTLGKLKYFLLEWTETVLKTLHIHG